MRVTAAVPQRWHRARATPAGEKWRCPSAPAWMNEPDISRPISSALVSRTGFGSDSRPCAITASRSQISNSSSSSSDTTSTATPLSRRSSSAWRICAAAPTSTPHVGCAAIITLRLLADLAADDVLLQVAAGEAARRRRPGRRPSRRTRGSSRPRRRARRPRARSRARPCASRCAVSSALSASDISGTAPRPSRSSGTNAKPSARRCAASRRPAGRRRGSSPCPASASVRSPDSAAISSFWPLPDTPAMPTISPARTVRLMSASDVPNGSSAGSVRSRTTSALRARLRVAMLRMRQVAADHHPRERRRATRGAGRTSPVTLPARSTVALWHSARISSSLWLM